MVPNRALREVVLDLAGALTESQVEAAIGAAETSNLPPEDFAEALWLVATNVEDPEVQRLVIGKLGEFAASQRIALCLKGGVSDNSRERMVAEMLAKDLFSSGEVVTMVYTQLELEDSRQMAVNILRSWLERPDTQILEGMIARLEVSSRKLFDLLVDVLRPFWRTLPVRSAFEGIVQRYRDSGEHLSNAAAALRVLNVVETLESEVIAAAKEVDSTYPECRRQCHG